MGTRLMDDLVLSQIMHEDPPVSGCPLKTRSFRSSDFNRSRSARNFCLGAKDQKLSRLTRVSKRQSDTEGLCIRERQTYGRFSFHNHITAKTWVLFLCHNACITGSGPQGTRSGSCNCYGFTRLFAHSVPGTA